MSEAEVGLGTFCCLFGASLLGVLCHPLLPARYRSAEAHEVVKLGASIVVAVVSVVLGLLTYSVKQEFDRTTSNQGQYAASLILLDRCLREYGPDAAEARKLLRQYTAGAIEQTWPEESGRPGRAYIPVENPALGQVLDGVESQIRAWQPPDPAHQKLAARCLALFENALTQRWTLVLEARQTIPLPLLIGLVAWLIIVFASFGLNAPNNLLVQVTLLLCSATIASVLYLTVEMDTPYNGLIKIPSTSMREALAHEAE
jgi:hypothetical protein